MRNLLIIVPIAITLVTAANAQEEHHHPMPEHLGSAHLQTSCAPAVTAAFDRAVALLHSFTYDQADLGFADVASRDPYCAMAHWGRAMTHYHQLWEVPVGAALAAGVAEINQAEAMKGTPRERALIAALGHYYEDADQASAAARALRYSDAMADVARDYPMDDEIATFYALSLRRPAAARSNGMPLSPMRLCRRSSHGPQRCGRHMQHPRRRGPLAVAGCQCSEDLGVRASDRGGHRDPDSLSVSHSKWPVFGGTSKVVIIADLRRLSISAADNELNCKTR